MQLGESKQFSNVENMDYTPVKEARPTLHGELRKIRDMGWKYFWNYYKWWVVGLLFLMLAGGIMARDIAKNKQPRLLTGAVYNCGTTGSAEDFAEELAEYMEIDLKKNPVKIMLNLKCEPDSVYSENSYLAEMKLEAQITARELDFIIGDELLVKSMCMHTGDVPYLADLRAVLPEEFYECLSDQLVWYPTAAGEEIPAVIDVSESKMAETLAFEQKPVYLGIVSNAQHAENAVKMLKYILDKDGKEIV